MDRDSVFMKLNYIKGLNKILSSRLNPLEQEIFDEVEYQLHNNLPIEKQKLYWLIPEMFFLEIADLEPIEQERIRKETLQIRVVS